MISKTLKTADGYTVVVKCTDKPERTTAYFKYEVVSIVGGNVNFRILQSPRNTSEGAGFTLLEIALDSTKYYITSSGSPEVVDNTRLYVHGLDTTKDSVILTLPLQTFNMFQLGMLVWNISVMNHNSKLIYKICNTCNHHSTETLPLIKVSTDFYLDCFSCCPMPEFADITFITSTDTYNENNKKNQVKAIISPWSPLKRKLTTCRAHISDILNAFRSDITEAQAAKVRVKNICTACHKVHNAKPWLVGVEWQMSESFIMCEDCNSKIHTCRSCNKTGLNYKQWGTSGTYICPNCENSSQCFICSLENSSTPLVPTVVVRHNNGGRNLCYTCSTKVDEVGWSFARLSSERSYSWKVNADVLKVMNLETSESTHHEEKLALEVVTTKPVCALEWEFPFSKTKCNTELRDRAIWLFEDAQEKAGYKDLFIAKHDGSLPSFATEFVSNMPKTLKVWHKLYFDGVLGKLAKLIDVDYINSHKSNVGGHIHISRASFTPAQISKVIKFLYSNVEFLEYVCGRSFAGSSYYAPSTNIHPLSFAYNKSAVSPEKYTIARVTHNNCAGIDMGTIEVRAFKAPATDVEVIQNIEFMFAMREYVRDISGKDLDKSKAFIDYTTKNIKMYPLLSEKLTSRNKKIFLPNTPSVAHISTVKRPSSRVNTPIDARGMALYVCSCCGNTFTCSPTNVLLDRSNNPLCTSCGITCTHCNSADLRDYATILGSHVFCEPCSESQTTYCDECDTTILRTDASQRDGSTLCTDCYEA